MLLKIKVLIGRRRVVEALAGEMRRSESPTQPSIRSPAEKLRFFASPLTGNREK
jgi:hypothetical protein